jgi:hypothetical protein
MCVDAASPSRQVFDLSRADQRFLNAKGRY